MRGIIVVTALTIALSASPAAADTALHLPDPTGRQPVGVTSPVRKDTSRPAPRVPSMNHRELMASSAGLASGAVTLTVALRLRGSLSSPATWSRCD
jgi:hypothetical protein